MKSLELDPKDKSIDPLTPVGIGNLAGKGVVKARKYDGLNLLGTSDARSLAPYADTRVMLLSIVVSLLST